MVKLKHRWGLEWAHIQKGEYRLYCDELYTGFSVKQNADGKWFISFKEYNGITREMKYKGQGQFDTAKKGMEIAETV